MINLDDDDEQTPQINLDLPGRVPVNPLPSDAVEDRSAVAAMGLTNSTGISQDEFKEAIAAGREGEIRQQAADKINQIKINMAKGMVDKYSDRLDDYTLQQMLKAQDPNSVFEEHYAKAWMDHLNWPVQDGKQDTWAWNVAYQHPGAWDYVKEAGNQYDAKFLYTNYKWVDTYGQTNWWDTVKSTAKDFATFGGYGEYVNRTGAAGTGFFSGGFGLGTNLDNQAINIWRLPFDEFKAEVDRVVGTMPPDLAAHWLRAMVGQTQAERFAGNLFTGLNVGIVGSLLPGKAAIQRAFVEGTAQLAYRRLTKAAADMVATRPIELSPKVAGPAVAGNLAEAGIQKVIIDNLNEINQNNNPLKTLTDRALNIYDVLNQSVSSNPGNFGREVSNRLSDLINSNKESFVETVMNPLLRRGDRTPAVELEKNVRAIHAGIADMFKGPDNMVLDISHSIYLPGLNVRMYNVAVGTHDAQMFGSIAEAKAVARRQGWIIKGDYAVTPEEMVNVNRQEAAIRGLRAQGKHAGADKIQAELDKLPRHDTGITIEGQFRPGEAYSAPIGPTMPSGPLGKPAGEPKPTKPTSTPGTTKPSPEPSKEVPGAVDLSGKAIWKNAAITSERGEGLPVDIIGSAYDKGGRPHVKVRYEGIEKPYDLEAPVDELTYQSKNVAEATGLRGRSRIPTGGHELSDLEKQFYEGSLGTRQTGHLSPKYLPGDIREGESTIQYYTRKKMEREWWTMSPEERAAYEETGELPKDIAERGIASTKTSPELPNDEVPDFAGKPSITDKLREFAEENPKSPLGILLKKSREGKPTPPTPKDMSDFQEDIQKFYGLPASVITQQGNGYYILHTVFLPEEADFVRDGLVTSRIGGLPVPELRRKLRLSEVDTGIPNDWTGGWINYILGRIRSPAERLSVAENLNRIIATHGPSVLLGMLEDGSKPIATMPPKFQREFGRMIRFLQRDWNEATGTPGRWFNSPAEVEDFYRTNFKRAPHETEIQAYFAYRTLMIDDLNMRNLAVMQRKLIMGAKQYAVTYMDKEGNKITTPFFEGVAVDKIPDSARVLEAKAESSKSSWKMSWRMKNRAEIEQDVAEGKAKIIHVFDPKSMPLGDLDKRTADYIVTYTNQEKPLGFNHVRALDGGHTIPKWGYYLKQALVTSHYKLKTSGEEDVIEGNSDAAFIKYLGTPSKNPGDLYDAYHSYEGDATLLNFRTRAEAEAAIPHLERVQKLLAEHNRLMSGDAEALSRWETEGGSTTAADRVYQQAADEAAYTGIPFDKLTKWWSGANAPFDVNQQIRVVPAGGKIINLDNTLREKYKGDNSTFVDSTKDGSLLGRALNGVGFMQDRDAEGLYTLRRTGTESNPMYAFEPAPLIDPITSMERAYAGIAKTMFMYDMKKFSIEHWVEQAKPYLQDYAAVRDNPLAIFSEGKYLPDTPEPIKANLEANRRMAMDFVGMGDPTSNSVTRIGQAISDWMFERSGGKWQVAAMYDLPKETDYYRWIRNVAFYASQISLKTFFTQASTISNIYFIAGPRNASKATAAMMAYGWWRYASGKPEILEGLDRSMARYFGWQPGRFTEAVNLMEGAGLHVVGNENPMRMGLTSKNIGFDENAGPISIGWKTMSQFGRTVLDYGSLPFNLGTSTTRRAAFFTAYLETLEKAPGGVIDRALGDAMLGRASLLDANMTTAFNTVLNKGAFSVPMQFNNYEKNMMELYWGKQLTPKEKTGLLVSSSLMFGMRGGFYAALGLPIANYLLGKTETAMGYVPGENPLADLAVNGFPSWMLHVVSGAPFIDYSRWGTRGLQPLEDIADEQSFLKVATGAAGSVFGQAWENTWGMRRALLDMMKPGGYRMTSDDVLQAFKTLSAYNDYNKARLGFQTGKLLTRNDTYVTDTSKVMALVQGLTGLAPIAAADVWIKQKQLSAQNEEIKIVEKEIAQEVMRGAIAGANNDDNTARQHWRNARALLEYIPVEKWNQAMRGAFLGVGKSLEDRVDWTLFKDNPDMLQKIMRNK